MYIIDYKSVVKYASIPIPIKRHVYVLCHWVKEGLKLVPKDAKHADVMDARKRILLAEDKILSITLVRKRKCEDKNSLQNLKLETAAVEIA